VLLRATQGFKAVRSCVAIARLLAQLFSMFLPWPIRRTILARVANCHVGKGAWIGYSLVLAEETCMGDGSRIGHLNVIKGVSRLALGEGSIIGNWNWVSGYPKMKTGPFSSESERRPELILGRHAALTNSHRVDCTNSVTIGEFTTVAGWGTQILTHSIDITTSRQVSAPVAIGRYCFIGTRSILLKGSSLPDYSVLGAGAVLTTRFDESYVLYAGSPAKRVRVINENSEYFCRSVGVVN